MSHYYEGFEELQRAVQIAKKQELLFKGVANEFLVTETAQNVLKKLNEFQKSINNYSGLLRIKEILNEHVQEVKDNEGLTEQEFEEKYRNIIDRSKKMGRNGWVISQYSNPADIRQWEFLLDKGEFKVSDYFDEDGIAVIDMVIDGLEKKYVSGGQQLYFHNGITAYKSKDYMTAAMYLLALLDNRVNALVEFPRKHMTNKDKYSSGGFENQKAEDYRELTERRAFFSKKIYFLEMYPSLIEYLNRVFYDGQYSFSNGIEPPYLNRNWLLHGRMARQIEKYECIQILNALSVAEFMFDKDDSFSFDTV